ncbi:MAG: hypothetical protein Q4C54_03865, partial [Clostridia bacterium]|nr:hypothetical protein [Clostridia bacterium]
MTKVTNKKDATKEIVSGANKALEKATQMRKNADALMQSLKKLENRFIKENEEREAQRKREEQQKVISAQSKAFTMLDDDEKAQLEAVKAAEKPAAKAEQKAAP